MCQHIIIQSDYQTQLFDVAKYKVIIFCTLLKYLLQTLYFLMVNANHRKV